LDVFFERNLKQGRLSFTTDLAEGVRNAEVLFLALPTPPGEDGSADLSYVLGVAGQLGPLLNSYKVIIDKSTVPVGTADLVREAILPGATVEFDVVSNPEFLREGFAVEDFMKTDRIVIGTESPRAREILTDLYSPYVRQGNPIYFMDERSAEMTKYAANSFLATKISFMNEIARLCERVGANVDQVRLGIGSDERIGKRFLFPGLGYGGSCFPKDVQALVHTANQNEYDFKILQAVMEVNQSQKAFFAQKILHFFQGDLKGKRIALWGLAFKPDTDDIREAPALDLIDTLREAGAEIVAFDPEAMPNVKQVLGDAIGYAESAYSALDQADALVVATEWAVFRNLNMDEIKNRLKAPVVFDGRNIFQPGKMKTLGFQYFSIGR
jgi:UDPglucose 6-dehydrogenase